MIGRSRRTKGSWWKRSGILLFSGMALVGVGGCGHVMMMMHGTNVERPAVSEFGFGPRASANKLYTGTLESAVPLRPRQMHTVHVVIQDGAGRPTEGAQITVDGGMPQHNHGLPTQPRVTKDLGRGRYEIEGVRFNMGGWWEFKLVVSTPAGADTVTFNLDL